MKSSERLRNLSERSVKEASRYAGGITNYVNRYYPGLYGGLGTAQAFYTFFRVADGEYFSGLINAGLTVALGAVSYVEHKKHEIQYKEDMQSIQQLAYTVGYMAGQTDAYKRMPILTSQNLHEISKN